MAPSSISAAEETAGRLTAAGFTGVRCWLQPNPVVPDEPLAYLATVTLGAPGTAEQYELLRTLDRELSASTPARHEPVDAEPVL